MGLNFEIKHYNELTVDEIYDLISLRVEIFSVEQEAVYNDLDGYDKFCFHLIGKNEDDKIISTTRIIPPGVKYDKTSFGRVALNKDYRKRGAGHQMINMVNDFIAEKYPKNGIKISAMLYLEKFYEEHGFKRSSDVYLDCEIEHIDMEIEEIKS